MMEVPLISSEEVENLQYCTSALHPWMEALQRILYLIENPLLSMINSLA
jgi:hypothetical protein